MPHEDDYMDPATYFHLDPERAEALLRTATEKQAAYAQARRSHTDAFLQEHPEYLKENLAKSMT